MSNSQEQQKQTPAKWLIIDQSWGKQFEFEGTVSVMAGVYICTNNEGEDIAFFPIIDTIAILEESFNLNLYDITDEEEEEAGYKPFKD